jgi:hypothetical protein
LTQSKKPARTCIFCGGGSSTGDSITKEHLWSDWMTSLLPDGDEYEEFRATISNSQNKILKETSRRRTGRANSKKLRVVCRSCNSGWMSRLEMTVQPFLTPLIKGAAFILTAEMQHAISQWIALKLFVAENDSFNGHLAEPIYPQKSRLDFMEQSTIPSGLRIWIALHHGVKWKTGFFITTSSMTFSKTLQDVAPPPNAEKNVQTVCWGIGNVFFYIVATTSSEFAIGMNELQVKNFVPLWPSASRNVLWPPAHSFEDSVLDTLPMALSELAVPGETLIQRRHRHFFTVPTISNIFR